jgi:hypothetical protein
MIKILAIGNSFSQDATAYLYDIAQNDNVELKVVNLYIGGCSLKTHWENAEYNKAVYQYEINGRTTGRAVSIYDALSEDIWDFVTLQQVSGDSGILDTYYPYIKNLYDYVSQYAPQAEQIIHQTWAYEIDSTHKSFSLYNSSQAEMYQLISDSYAFVAADLALRIIPSSDVIQSLRANRLFDYSSGGLSLCRDGYHMSLIYGRYAAAATWYESLVKNSILKNHFVPAATDGEPINKEYLKLIKECVHETVAFRK